MPDKKRNLPQTSSRPAPAGDRRRRRLHRKVRRLAQAGVFAAVRGAAYALGGTAGAWLILWLAAHR